VEVHPLHPVVLVLGVLFGLRRLDVSQRTSDQYPGVDPAGFSRWKLLAAGAYRLGLTACFGKVLLDYALAYLFSTISPAAFPRAARIAIGLTLDVGWVVLVVLAFLRARKAHALARELGVERPRA
jgi:hypothetical protein